MAPSPPSDPLAPSPGLLSPSLDREALVLWTLAVATPSLLAPGGAWLGLLVWLPGAALWALPILARVPASQRRILNGCWLALLAIWGGAVGAVSLVASEDDLGFGLLTAMCALSLSPFPGLWLACRWVASGLQRLRDPLAAWPCEAARVLMLALPASFPLGMLGYRVSKALFKSGAAWELSGPGLLGPRWAGALSGAGVCVLGALWLRLRCAPRAPDLVEEVA